jgi:ribonuclease HI
METIITDSETGLKALYDISSTTTFVQTIHRLQYELECEDTRISFQWVRSHNNNAGNELAKLSFNLDQLSKEGAVSHNKIAYDQYPITFLKKTIYEKNFQI